MTVDRSNTWKTIWDEKGKHVNVPIHQVDGFDLLNDEQWDYMISQVAKPICIKNGESVFECGCGAGAFLSSLLRQYPDLRVSGIDYSESLLTTARRNLSGDFYCGDMTDLTFIQDNHFDHAVSFSTFHYLSSEESARKVVREMVRITKNGGVICIGEVSDLAKKEEALAIRKKTHKDHKRVSFQNPDHLFLSKDLFRELSDDLRLLINIIDHETFDLPFYETAKYRYSVYLSTK